jgi:hypothetical protein
MRAGEKRVFAFALGGQGIEADERFVDETGMAHHEPASGMPRGIAASGRRNRRFEKS